MTSKGRNRQHGPQVLDMTQQNSNVTATLANCAQLARFVVDLDCNASAPLDPLAAAAMAAALELDVGNPSSLHGKGQAGRALVELGRRQLAQAIGAQPTELALTSGATEANSLAWHGILQPMLAKGARPVVVTTAVEHASVSGLARHFAGCGLQVRYLDVDDRGRWRLDQFDHILQGDIALVSAIWVNNETGVVHEMAQLANAARGRGALVHCDATQALGRIAVDVTALGVDVLSLSGHKFGAPKGIGALWLRPGVPITALQPGHQEQGLRAGTENVIGIAGLAAAAPSVTTRLDAVPAVRALRDRLWHQLRDQPDLGALRNADVHPDQESGHVLNISFAGVPAAVAVMALDLAGVLCSAGSACASGTMAPSHVQLAMHGDTEAGKARAGQAVRFSLGPHHDCAAIDTAAAIIARVVRHLGATTAGAGLQNGP